MEICLPSHNNDTLRLGTLNFDVWISSIGLDVILLTFDIDGSILFDHIEVVQRVRCRCIFDVSSGNTEASWRIIRMVPSR